jgi:hypothetical protein
MYSRSFRLSALLGCGEVKSGDRAFTEFLIKIMASNRNTGPDGPRRENIMMQDGIGGLDGRWHGRRC